MRRVREAPDPAAIDGCAAIAMYRGTLAMLPASEDEGDGSSSDTGDVGAPRSAFALERDGFNLHAACGSKQATTLDANVSAVMDRAPRSRSNAFGGCREDASPTV